MLELYSFDLTTVQYNIVHFDGYCTTNAAQILSTLLAR